MGLRLLVAKKISGVGFLSSLRAAAEKPKTRLKNDVIAIFIINFPLVDLGLIISTLFL